MSSRPPSAHPGAGPIPVRLPTRWRWTWGPFEVLSVDALHDFLALRQRVFVVEQRCAYLDITGADRLAWHLCGWDDTALNSGARGVPGAPQLAAYARIFPPGVYDPDPVAVVGRVAVAPEYRGRGLGYAVVAEALARLFAQGGPVPSKLSAQAHLEALYARLGYATCGPGFLEDDIPHLPMARPAIPAPGLQVSRDPAGAPRPQVVRP